MSVKYVNRQSDASADAFPARSTAAGLMVDSDDNKLKLNPDGTVVQIVDTAHDFTLAGAISFTGATAGLRDSVTNTTADTIAVTAAESGKTYICARTSTTQVFTLPAAAAGLKYTFVAGHADTEIHIGTGTASVIKGKTHGANDATGIITTATTGLLKNTAATNVVGDHTTLVCDGTDWFMTSVAGVWSAT